MDMVPQPGRNAGTLVEEVRETTSAALDSSGIVQREWPQDPVATVAA